MRSNSAIDGYVRTGETYGPANSPIFMKNGKKYIKIINGKDSRYLILPNTEPNVNCTQMMAEEWNKYIEKTKYPTLDEREKMKDEYLKNQRIKQEESMKRKKELQKAMEAAEKVRKLDPLEKETEFHKRYVLNRANDLLLDEEDCMKEFNRMIALKKCIATWDEQMLEKAKIADDRKKEKLLQEKEVERKRRLYIKEDDAERQKVQTDMQNFIKALGEQIKEREIDKKLQRAKKQLETYRFNKAIRESEADELKALQKKSKENEKLREEQRRVNVLLQRLHAINKEEEKIFDLKAYAAAMEIQKEVDEIKEHKREIEKKRKEELKKMADEKVKAEERAKFKDLMEEVLRMDNIERTWRQKELIEAREKQKRLDEMYSQLELQVDSRRLAKAQVIEEERREVCKVAKDNVEDEIKDREAQRKIKIANEKQRMELLLQINESERRKLQEREDRNLESNFFRIKEEKSIERAKNGMWRRVDSLKQDGMPKKYIQEVENYVVDKFGPRTDKKQKDNQS